MKGCGIRLAVRLREAMRHAEAVGLAGRRAAAASRAQEHTDAHPSALQASPPQQRLTQACQAGHAKQAQMAELQADAAPGHQVENLAELAAAQRGGSRRYSSSLVEGNELI